MDEDYYKILGVPRDAPQAEIQKAYRAMARRYHPDMNPDDKAAKEKFQRIQHAYDVLGNPEKRELYDRYGSAFETMGAGGPGGGGRRTRAAGGGGPGFEEIDFSELFGGRGGGGFDGGFADIFRHFSEAGGARRGRREPARGDDLQAEITVPFQTAVAGGEVRFSLQRGGQPETIAVKIPAGIEDGKKIRIRGHGEPSPKGQQPGDLYLTVHVLPHPLYRRSGRDLEVKLAVTLAEAALGARIDVPTPRGTVAVKVPAGSSSGRRLRIKGHGVKTADGEVGDMYAVLQITIPASLDDKAAALVRQFDQAQPLNPRAELRW